MTTEAKTFTIHDARRACLLELATLIQRLGSDAPHELTDAGIRAALLAIGDGFDVVPIVQHYASKDVVTVKTKQTLQAEISDDEVERLFAPENSAPMTTEPPARIENPEWPPGRLWDASDPVEHQWCLTDSPGDLTPCKWIVGQRIIFGAGKVMWPCLLPTKRRQPTVDDMVLVLRSETPPDYHEPIIEQIKSGGDPLRDVLTVGSDTNILAEVYARACRIRP